MTWTITHIASQDPGKTTPRIADERDQPVAYVLQPEHAKLIAAAPELLKTLIATQSLLVDLGLESSDEYWANANAINNATQ